MQNLVRWEEVSREAVESMEKGCRAWTASAFVDDIPPVPSARVEKLEEKEEEGRTRIVRNWKFILECLVMEGTPAALGRGDELENYIEAEARWRQKTQREQRAAHATVWSLFCKESIKTLVSEESRHRDTIQKTYKEVKRQVHEGYQPRRLEKESLKSLKKPVRGKRLASLCSTLSPSDHYHHRERHVILRILREHRVLHSQAMSCPTDSGNFIPRPPSVPNTFSVPPSPPPPEFPLRAQALDREEQFNRKLISKQLDCATRDLASASAYLSCKAVVPGRGMEYLSSLMSH